MADPIFHLFGGALEPPEKGFIDIVRSLIDSDIMKD